MTLVSVEANRLDTLLSLSTADMRRHMSFIEHPGEVIRFRYLDKIL